MSQRRRHQFAEKTLGVNPALLQVDLDVANERDEARRARPAGRDRRATGTTAAAADSAVRRATRICQVGLAGCSVTPDRFVRIGTEHGSKAVASCPRCAQAVTGRRS